MGSHVGDGEILHELLPPEDPDEDPWPLVRNPKKRAWLRGYALTGLKKAASKAAGVGVMAYKSRSWMSDPHFVAALAVAEQMYADMLEDEATRRAVHGERRYKFDRGEPRIHPDRCECGHDRRKYHARAEIKRPAGISLPGEKEEVVTEILWGPCLRAGCECGGFQGEPYYELEKSDHLLEVMMKAARPNKFAQRVLTGPDLRDLDLERIAATGPAGQALVARIARGDNPYAVLATATEEVLKLLPGKLPPLEDSPPEGAELGGPGTAVRRPPDEEEEL
ncbi:MAG: hypothetical protein AB7Q29_16145 [Vicinamibacterales bacterium]